MFGASPDIAGGVVSATLADGDNEQTVFGCKAVRQSTGNVLITTRDAIPVGRGRIWVTLLSATPFLTYTAQQTDTNEWTVITSIMSVNGVPALVGALSNKAFAFGISAIPD